MSKLQEILVNAKAELSPWEPIPQNKWGTIASQCGSEELAEITLRIEKLHKELQDVEAWDGDTQDDIHQTLAFFNEIMALANKAGSWIGQAEDAMQPNTYRSHVRYSKRSEHSPEQ
jgi:hypothetical protein